MMEDFGRTYDDSYADLIEQGATKVILADGLELELRPMPDESREHALDPRVFELTRKRLSGEGWTLRPCATVRTRRTTTSIQAM